MVAQLLLFSTASDIIQQYIPGCNLNYFLYLAFVIVIIRLFYVVIQVMCVKKEVREEKVMSACHSLSSIAAIKNSNEPGPSWKINSINI